MAHSDPTELAPVPARIRPTDPAVRGAPSQLAPISTTPDALSLLKALRRRWAIALVLGLLASGSTGAAAWFLIPKAQYSTAATLRVYTKPQWTIFEPNEQTSDYHTYQKTQLALIKDQKVLIHALGTPKVKDLPTVREQEDKIEWLEKELKAEFQGGSEVLKVSMSGERPKDLEVIVNAVVASYIDLIVNEENRQRVERLDRLKAIRLKYQTDLSALRQEFREKAELAGTSDQFAMALAQQDQAELLGIMQKEKNAAKSELLKAQVNLEKLQEMARAAAQRTISESEVAARVEQDPAVAELLERLGDLAERYQQAKRIARSPSDPTVVAASRAWFDAKADLDRLRQQGRAAIIKEFRRGRDEGIAQHLADAKGEVGELSNLINALDREIQDLQANRKETSKTSLDLDRQRQELAILTEVTQKVASEVEAVQVELDAPDRISVLSDARVPTMRDGERQIKMSGIAALGAFACTLLGISYWEFRARRIASADDVSTNLGLRLVGSLPALPTRSQALRRAPDSGAMDRHWQNLLIESVDAMRTVLLHDSRVESVRVVMVTSAIKGEGKTSLACHLATSLARAGRNTLLMDFDLRSPACHQLFDLPPSPGICDLLRGEAGLDEVVRATPADHLFVVPAGRGDEVAIQALARYDLDALFDGLQGQYDFIIIDSAPVLHVADTLLIGQHVDAVLLSILRDVSRMPMVHATYGRLAALGIKILGGVVTGVPSDAYTYGQYAAPQSVG